MGATPEKLAWSIAIGLVIGINPILGSTTLVCLAAAAVLRLNLVASQIGNHIVYPLQLILLIPFVHLGTLLFHTAPLKLTTGEILGFARRHPIALIREIWQWEWHALVVWAIAAAILAPIFFLILVPVLRRLLNRIERHQYPVLTPATDPRKS